MKKVYRGLSTPICILTSLSFLVLTSTGYGQTVQKNNTTKQKKGIVTKWTQNPFDHTIFIENRGQFNKDVPAGNKVLFQAMLGSINAYFTTNGIVYRWDEQIKESGEEKNDPDAIKINHKMHYLTMHWENCNPNVSVDAKEERKDYYIYPITASSSINVNLFKKIVYRNLYPGIDAEFIFPKGGKTGIKYSLIVHPGADLSKVKIKYSGSNGMKLDREGNVVVQSEMQDFTEHAPSAAYEGEYNEAPVKFEVNNNEESFDVKDLDKTKTLLIDPWITNPLYSYSTNSAYDLDFDNNGNVYAYGGYNPYQLVQLNSLGAIVWTYNATPFNTGYYGDVVVGRKTGTSYLIEGFNGSGARVEKISNLGALMATYPGTSNLVEMWRAEYNPCNDNIVIAAGGTTADNQACMLDTNMISITPVNVLSSGTALHDMSLIGIDPSGKFAYMGTAQSVVYPTVYNNVIMQLPIPTLSPTTYLTYDGLAFKEVGSITYVAPGTGRANGMNGMAASPNWLYVYDGSYLKERNKASGAEVDSVFVTNTSFQWGGLDVDACDNIYAGLKDSIYVYDVSLAVTNKIALTNTVFDVVLGQNDLLYACGKGFVTSMSVPAPSKLISTAAGTPTSCSACDGKATVTVNCGVAPFSYLWSNGSTGSVDSNLCAGIYTVTVTDGSCPPRQDTAIVNISGKSGYTATVTDTNPDCGIKKGNITIFPTGGTAPYSYNWSNGETNQKDTGIGAGTYTCVVTDNGGCKYTVVTTLINPTAPIVKISPTPDSVCLGSSTSLTASGAKTYVWNPGSLVGTTVIVSPLTTTTYTVSALDSNGCNGSATITVVVNPVPTVSIVPPSDSICSGSGVTITASGASTYTWTPATGLSCLSCANPLASPTVTTTYTVVGKNGHGCIDSSTVKIVVKPKPVPTITVIPTSDTICNGDSAMLIAGGGGAYDWTFSGSPNDTVWVKPASSTIYTLQVTLDGCVATINTKVIVVGAGVPKITVSKDSICKGDSTMLTASGGGTYKWLVAGNPTSASIWVKPGSNATYSVVVTTPCGKDTVTSKLIHVLPYPVITPSPNATICRGNSTTLSASGGTSYVWSNGATTTSINVSPTSTKTYTVTVSNGLCISDTTITVTVDTPAVLTITPDQKICIGDSITLTATGGPSYKWSNGATTSSIKVGPNSTTTYTCVVNKNGCLDSTSTTVTVDVPVLNICCDKTIMPGGADTIGVTPGFSSYLWAPNTNISCITVNCDTIIATPSVTTTYVVNAKDAAGCTISRQVTVFVEIPCADFEVPNIFTPNNDGRNDDFVINILNPSTYSIVIYDRWGKEVYTSTDPTVYWNGKVMGTQYLVSDGIYYYIIKATCGSNDYVKKGFVQVVGEQ